MRNRTYFFLLAISGSLFLLLFLVVSYYNRLAADDFYYLGGYTEKGVWGCMRDLYYGYSARWTAYLFTGWIISMNAFTYYHFFFNGITLLIMILSFYFLVKNIVYKILSIKLSAKLNILYALILSCSLFFSSYSISETWFWLVQVCTYLWSIIMSLILLNILVNERFKPVHYLLIIITTVFIGGASESFALVNIFLLSSYLGLSNSGLKKNSFISFPKHQNTNKKIMLALIFLLISFTITMVAPGNEIRYSALPKAGFIETVWIQIKSFIKIIFIRTPLKLHYLFLFSFPWLVLGKYLSQSLPKSNLITALFSLKKYFILLLILVFIFLVPTSFIMSEIGPDRALSQISFLICLCFSAFFFFTGYFVEINNKAFQILKTGTALISIGVLLFHLNKQFSSTKKYANAFDQRMNLLEELNKSGQNNIIELNTLPSPGMIYSAEISEDTNYFTNNFLEYALHLKFDIKKKSNHP
ncbi:MAG TPA: DUF6056 family protein [Bacteroidia bacterium]|nr:DUF6056 family protein [Bacteroidia bacterium]